MKTAPKQSGFLLLDALFSFGMFLLLCTLLLPLWIDLRKEQLIQETKATYYSLLQNELAKPNPKNQKSYEGELVVELAFSIEDGMKKGCLELKGGGRKESSCLYGYLE
ncbi:competence protein ComGE [Terribacillus halophilus]|uniref:Competence protein ComGE n=1 Tax=Terribacillus halophilus TaxID=361279 RepID=A0A1G6VLH2_9BACI|nr:hypothetical protein [Terribacillus halophilus]SDD53745.1 competence protein ComGE [Terribacillus halophilus]